MQIPIKVKKKMSKTKLSVEKKIRKKITERNNKMFKSSLLLCKNCV